MFASNLLFRIYLVDWRRKTGNWLDCTRFLEHKLLSLTFVSFGSVLFKLSSFFPYIRRYWNAASGGDESAFTQNLWSMNITSARKTDL